MIKEMVELRIRLVIKMDDKHYSFPKTINAINKNFNENKDQIAKLLHRDIKGINASLKVL